MAECSTEPFEVVGDPDALSDALIEALAAMLLDNEQKRKSHLEAEERSE